MINTIATTNLSSVPPGSFASPEGKGFDPYSDLFAALFTFPAPVQPEPLIVDKPTIVGSDETADLGAAGAASDLQTVPLLAEPAKPAKDNSAGILGLFPKVTEPLAQSERIALPADTKLPLDKKPPIEYLGPPVKQSPPRDPKLAAISREEDLRINFGDVCGLPVFRSDTAAVSAVGVPDPTLVPIIGEQLRMVKDEQLSEIEPLELPLVPPPIDSKMEQEVILEITSLDLSTLEVVSVDGTASNEVRTPTSSPLELNEKLPTVFPEAQPKQPDKVSLLETFATNVLVDNKTPASPTGRSAMNGPFDTDSIFLEPVKPIEEATAGEQPTEFSFGTPLDGNKGLEQFDKPITSEFKLKRIILDQVGAAFTDLALGKKETGEKRTLKIRLSPAELGTVEITLAKNANGMIDAHFQTDNPKTQHVLQESLAQLRESLERSGMQVGSLNTSCTSFSSGGRDGSDSRRHEFTNSDDQTGKRPTFDTVQKSEDDKQSRLVNLRA